MQAALPMGNNKITGLATPTVATDAATKAYVDTFPLPDKSVTLQKLYHPSTTSLLLGTDSVAAQNITAVQSHAGLIQLIVGSTAGFSTGQVKTVSDVTGTTEANGTWTITVLDGTHIDLQGSTFVNGYAGGGTIGGAVEEITLGGGLSMSGNTLSATNNPALIPNYLSGLTMSGGGSGSMTIAAGVANDSTNANLMSLGSSIVKNTASWAVGSGNGGLDGGAIAANTWYHFFLIKRVDTGVVDVLFSQSPTSPTMPANYTLKRRIGSAKTDGSSNWTSFTQVGDQFIWLNPVTDLNASPTAGSRITFGVSVPTGIVVTALFRGAISNVTAATETIIFSSLLESGGTAAVDLFAPVNSGAAGSFARITNTSAQIGFLAATSTALLQLATYGWVDTRGK